LKIRRELFFWWKRQTETERTALAFGGFKDDFSTMGVNHPFCQINADTCAVWALVSLGL